VDYLGSPVINVACLPIMIVIVIVIVVVAAAVVIKGVQGDGTFYCQTRIDR